MKFYITIALLFCSVMGLAQTQLSGMITDADSGSALEGVSVYFPELEKGVVTDINGAFSLKNLPEGKFNLVASYIGFSTFSEQVTLTAGANTLHIQLKTTAIEIGEVVLSTPFHKLERENVMKVEVMSIDAFKTSGSMVLSAGLEEIPGVSNVSTGTAIGKPVIRGLSGNRVLVYAQGIRLENQQFGAEHGLGLSAYGVSGIEVIKGPASLLYGSDALGGVIYINPESFALPNSSTGDVNFDYYSNTVGLGSNIGFKTSNDNWRFLVRAGLNAHADYKTGNGQRITNTRFQEKDMKLGLGYQVANFKTEVRYNYTDSEIGIPEEMGIQSRSFDPLLPNQGLNNHMLTSKTNLFLGESRIEATIGYTLNVRKEFEEHEHEEVIDAPVVEEEEEGDHAALDMNLKTFTYNVLYHLPKRNKIETIFGVQGMRQSNENHGEETLIPNAITSDFGVLGTIHYHHNKSGLQAGVRFDHRSLEGTQMGFTGEEGFIPAIDRSFASFNAALGMRHDFSEKLIGRLNLASGFRAPNLAELTSNGVHHGANRYEVGNPNLENEKNIQLDTGLDYVSEHWEFYANVFYNSVSDFIYLQPTGEELADAPVFNYLQQKAKLYGGEFGVHIHPHPLDWLHLESAYATVVGKLDNGGYIPLIPANNLKNTLRFEFGKKESPGYAYLTLQTFFSQNNTGDFESETLGYNLLNLGVGQEVSFLGFPTVFRITAQNVLNESYVSHLSRLKTDGILNMGRNINFGMQMKF